MSYARFGAGGSNVYVYLSVGNDKWPAGWLECCGCLLSEIDGGPYFYRARLTAEMIDHLREHERAGHIVPRSTYEQLREDATSNDAALAGVA